VVSMLRKRLQCVSGDEIGNICFAHKKRTQYTFVDF
jgi:hypothetical protein